MMYPVRAGTSGILHLAELDGPSPAQFVIPRCGRRLVSPIIYDTGIVGPRRCSRCGDDQTFDGINEQLVDLEASRRQEAQRQAAWRTAELARKRAGREAIARHLEGVLGKTLVDGLNPVVVVESVYLPGSSTLSVQLQYEEGISYEIKVSIR